MSIKLPALDPIGLQTIRIFLRVCVFRILGTEKIPNPIHDCLMYVVESSATEEII